MTYTKTVKTYEYDSEGNLTKETETTETYANGGTYVAPTTPWVNPYRRDCPIYVTNEVVDLDTLSRIQG